MHHITEVFGQIARVGFPKPLRPLFLLILSLLPLSACDTAINDEPLLSTDDVEVLINAAMDAQGRPYLDVSATNETGRTLGFLNLKFTFFRDGAQVKSSVFPVPNDLVDRETVQGTIPLWTSFDSHDDYDCYRYELYISDREDNNAEETYPGTCK